MKNEPKILTRGPHKGMIAQVIKVVGGDMKQFTMYYTPEQWARMEKAKSFYCSCKVPAGGGMRADGVCECGVYKHHNHCVLCGKLVQVG